MNRVIVIMLVSLVSVTAMAQQVMDDGSRVVLPLETQQCKLPLAPPPISETPEKSDLLGAQKHVKRFQAEMEVYRECLDKDTDSPDLSSGNQQAISNAHNYSVDMEERVAAMFNEAVRAYKENLAKD